MYAVLELRPKNFISKNVKIITHEKRQITREHLIKLAQETRSTMGFYQLGDSHAQTHSEPSWEQLHA